MCGRFALSANAGEIEKLLPNFYGKEYIVPRYNIAPSQKIACILNTQPDKITFAKWGLIPSWAKDDGAANSFINSRSESLLEKPAFKHSFQKKRCLILADGFYEWKKEEGSSKKQPYFIRLKTGKPFFFAGIWATRVIDGVETVTASIITTEPNFLMERIHNRMPVIIAEENYEKWLSSSANISELTSLMKPYPADEMEAYPVSTLVNSPANDISDCSAPLNSFF